ncbi:hypothetical protein [Salinispora sp. H7-4]|uniref:hypothetical protein n=1 Tax=Salinispora sp. H7-4 TaxID=2748321 RepID=UPI0015D29EB8|nr:hypothetical protein [Salinispora sp. H7-4]NYT92310.1 hypothetical protein [Salinispora sp. H7-4]
MTAPHARYLSAAANSGLLHELDSLVLVAGTLTEPVTGETQCLVEYCDPGLVTDARRRRRLVRHLAERFPEADRAVVRVPAPQEPPSGWSPYLTYVRHGARPGTEALAQPPVRPAEPADDARIAKWMVQAFLAAAGGSAPAERLAELAEQILAAPDRLSYLVGTRDEPAGHAILLLESHDQVTGEDFVELLDVLVEPATNRAAREALVAVCVATAAAAGLPLVGHVVHGADPGVGDRVVSSLTRKGWLVDHHFHAVPLESSIDDR